MFFSSIRYNSTRLSRIHQIPKYCHHAHLDKAFTIHHYDGKDGEKHMKEKWVIMQNVKKHYTYESLLYRMNMGVKRLAVQKCKHIRTFIDVDSIVQLDCVHAALALKKMWKTLGVTIQLATQPLEGLETDENIDLFERAAELVDIVGCLPGRDTDPEHHLDVAFTTASKLGKIVEAHVDQCNVPYEKETELLCDWTKKYGYEGKVRAIHGISLACQPIDYQLKIARYMNDLRVGLIVCPSAGISMTQHSEYEAPIHNSLAPVKLLLDEGVYLGLGVDNMEDVFMPLCNGDLEFEMRLLAESQRIYDISTLETLISNDMGFK